MTSVRSTVLVAGATGAVGGLVVRKLLEHGIPVRAIGRNPAKLAVLAALGAEALEVDLLDRPAVERACEGVDQIYTSANNVMGSGSNSPNRVDVPAHETLCTAARAAGVRRIVYLSGRGKTDGSPVDFFRTKGAIETVIRKSGVPFVMIRPGAFIEIWVGMLVAGLRKNGTVVLFGDGLSVGNYIAGEDVAALSLQILLRDDVVNEIIDIGGPSNLSLDEIATLVGRRMGVAVKRRRIPKAVLWTGGLVVRPFNEVAARFMRMGYYTATSDNRFNDWPIAAERFGVNPMSVETYLSGMTMP